MLLEGLSDEVTACLVALLAVAVAYVAWLSTAVARRPLNVRTVIVGRRVLRLDERQQVVADSFGESTDEERGAASEVSAADPPSAATEQGTEVSGSLHMTESTAATTPAPNESCCESGSGATESPDAAHDESGAAAAPATSSAPDSSPPQHSASPSVITFKLKFLNDDERIVHGDRTELLQMLKRRYFPDELSAGRYVRLIFNGRQLPDTSSLADCGLYDQCVVHCHVSAARPPAAAAGGGAAAAGASSTEDELNVGVLLQPLLVSMLAVLWTVQQQLPQLFSSAASWLLSVLTVLLAASLLHSLLLHRHQRHQRQRA